MNITVVFGNAGRDAELREVNDDDVAQFSLADNYGEDEDDVNWYNVSAWGNQSEFVAEKVRSGARVLAIGTLKTREWEDEDGELRTSLDLNAWRVQIIDWPDDDDDEDDDADDENARRSRRSKSRSKGSRKNSNSSNRSRSNSGKNTGGKRRKRRGGAW